MSSEANTCKIRKMKNAVFDSSKLSLIVLTLGLLSSSHSAPTKPTDSTSNEWWNQPCDTDLTKIRHSRSTDGGVMNIRNQLNIFNKQVNSYVNEINSLYNVSGTKAKKITPKSKLSWLRIKTITKKLNNAKTLEEYLITLYDAAQRFAGTLEVLRHIQIKPKGFVFRQDKRDTIYQNITYQMRNLLCEIYDVLKPNKVPKGLSLSAMKIEKFNKKLDLTAGHMMDFNFLKKTKSFFRRNVKTSLNKHLNKKKNSAKKTKKTGNGKKRT